MNLQTKLIKWRDKTAKNEGVDSYRILSNQTIDLVVKAKPKNKEELVLVKGIKEKKFEKYGKDILDLINGNNDENDDFFDDNLKTDDKTKIYTVSSYLDLLNYDLRNRFVKIIGEISSIDIRGTYLFFALKDKKDGSLLNSFMWKNDYNICSIDAKEGMEVIINGYAEIYKPSGRLSLKASSIELVGEGALKKAYDELKKKLEKEGLFASERKKELPLFPKNIGLITSETGAVIHDFLNNLGKHGYKIKFVNSRVEGQIAVHNLLSAIKSFDNKDIDVLVIIRGGGSLESLQAFNNEELVRTIANFKKPVICGIGHDKDIPLASMVADISVSTPTAVTSILDKTWDQAIGYIDLLERDLLYKYKNALDNKGYIIDKLSNNLSKNFIAIFKKFEDFKHKLIEALYEIKNNINNIKNVIIVYKNSILNNFESLIKYNNNNLNNIEKQLIIFDPIKQLKLGYSIVLFDGKIIKSKKDINVNDFVDIQMYDGKIKAKIDSVKDSNDSI